MINAYNGEVARFEQRCENLTKGNRKDLVDAFIDLDSTKISWNRADKNQLARGVRYAFRNEAMTIGSYRPFSKQRAYFDRRLNDMIYRLDRVFPTSGASNRGFYVTGVGSDRPFSALMVDHLPDLAFWGSSNGQLFPR